MIAVLNQVQAFGCAAESPWRGSGKRLYCVLPAGNRKMWITPSLGRTILLPAVNRLATAAVLLLVSR